MAMLRPAVWPSWPPWWPTKENWTGSGSCPRRLGLKCTTRFNKSPITLCASSRPISRKEALINFSKILLLLFLCIVIYVDFGNSGHSCHFGHLRRNFINPMGWDLDVEMAVDSSGALACGKQLPWFDRSKRWVEHGCPDVFGLTDVYCTRSFNIFILSQDLSRRKVSYWSTSYR